MVEIDDFLEPQELLELGLKEGDIEPPIDNEVSLWLLGLLEGDEYPIYHLES